MNIKLLKKSILFITLGFTLTACTSKNYVIKDLKEYSQDPSTYTKQIKATNLDKEELKNEFLEKYFLVWNQNKLNISIKEASWGNEYLEKEFYFANQNKVPKSWLEEAASNQNFEEFNTVLQKAILIKNSDVRVLPSKNSLFNDPSSLGEGYPFDYNQNSRLKVNTPLMISHYSKDKVWAFIDSYTVQGWVRVDNIKFINEEEQKLFENSPLYIITKEGYEVFDTTLLEELKVSTIFPKVKDKYLLATSSGFKKVNIKKDKLQSFPLDFSKETIDLVAKEFIDERYAWGGLNNNRDCSAFTQDFFTLFGIYIKRNSRAQTYLHKYDDISKLSNKEKKDYIIKNAKPFLTLIYLDGHIMLYIGEKNNEPLVMHNFWSIRTYSLLGESRTVIGKTSITTLEPGKELINIIDEKTLLSRTSGIVHLSTKK